MTEPMPEIAPEPECTALRPLDDHARAEIAALAARQSSANGVLMKAVNYVGGQVESGLRSLPQGVRTQVDRAARLGLEKSFNFAAKTRTGVIGRTFGTDRTHRVLGTVSGAIGGIGGITTALTELPFATTIIFRAVQAVAEEHGEDPKAEETRMQCLAVFGAGGQAVPVLGAIAGAGTNYAFVDYYVQMAHVHFGLRRLFRSYGEAQVTEEFHRALAAPQTPVNRA